MSTEIVTSNDKQLQHKNQKQLEAKYCLDGKLQMKLSWLIVFPGLLLIAPRKDGFFHYCLNSQKGPLKAFIAD